MKNNDAVAFTGDMKTRAEKFIEVFNKAPIAKSFGMTLTYDDAGRAVLHQPYNPDFNHGLGDVHGGVLATMIDNAGWFTAALYYDTWINTVDLTVHMLEPANSEALRAVGTIVRAGAHLAVTSMEVRSESGRLVATGCGTFSVSNIPFGSEK